MALHTFEDLEVWKRACRLAVDVCVETHDRRPYELFRQMQRAAISVPSNIAEGSERDSDGDFVRFLRISKGSCGELRTQLYIAERVAKCLGEEILDRGEEMIEETRGISAMLQKLIRSIQKSDD
jgi:four helix bundle protein